MPNCDFNALEFERASIVKRLGILRFLALIESLIVLYLAFVLSKDAIISLCIAVFVGVFFYRFLSRRLLARQNFIQRECLRQFLAQQNAEFQNDSLNEKALQRLALPFESIKTSGGTQFRAFKLYDISFKNASNGAFIGVLLVLQNAVFKPNLPSIDENTLFQRLSNKDFDTQRLFIKGEFALIATIRNPFFVDFRLNLNQNLAQMKANLDKIQSLIA